MEVDPLQLLCKGLQFLGLMLLLGSTWFEWCVLDSAAASRQRLRWAMLAGALLLATGAGGEGLDRVWQMTGSLDGSDTGDYFTTARSGQMAALRAVLAMLFLIYAWPPLDRKARRRGPGLLLFGVPLLCTLTLVSHGAQGRWKLPALMDVAHLAAASAWCGMLFSEVLLSFREASAIQAARLRLPRISAISLSCVVVLSVTGVGAAWVHLGTWSALLDSDYGRALLLKLAMVAAVLLVAGVNRVILMPQLDRDPKVRLLLRLVAVESMLMILVIAATTLLVTRDPPSSQDPPTSWLLPETVHADSPPEMWQVGQVEGSPRDGTHILEMRIYKTQTWLGRKDKGVVFIALQGDMQGQSSLNSLEFQSFLTRVGEAENRLPTLPPGANADIGTVGGVGLSVSCTSTGRRFLHVLVNGPSIDVASDDLGRLDDLLSDTKSQLDAGPGVVRSHTR